MTPASQRYETTLSEDSTIIQRGDCLAACVATVLDCDISECDILRFNKDTTLEGFWSNLHEWSYQRGVQWIEFSGRDNHEIRDLPNVIAIGRPAKEVPPAMRSLDHAVVYSMGREVWDPNPKKIGVGTVNWYLVPSIASAIKFMTWRFPHMQYISKTESPAPVMSTEELVRRVKQHQAKRSKTYRELDNEVEFEKKEWDGQEVVSSDIYWKSGQQSQMEQDLQVADKIKSMTPEEIEALADQFRGHDKRHRSYKG